MRRHLALVAVLAFAPPSWGTTIRVPEDIATVLAAVDSASPGDTVQIGPGTWTDRSTRVVWSAGTPFVVTSCAFARGPLTLRGAGMDQTVVDAGESGTGILEAISILEEATGPVVLEDLGLTGARHAVSSSATVGLDVRRCRFFGNQATGQAGDREGAVILMGLSPVTLVDSEIVNNASLGGAVFLRMGDVLIEGCLFEGNQGRCVQIDQAGGNFDTSILGNRFIRNRGEGYGTGVFLGGALGYTVRGNLFLENVATTDPGAGLMVSGCYGEVSFNTFVRDSCLASNARGGGVRWFSSQGAVRNNTFVGCFSRLGGSAFSGQDGHVLFHSNVVAHSAEAVAVNATGLAVSSQCNDFWANASGNFGNWTPGPTDITADPLFCGLEAMDLTVREGSPCADPSNPNCPSIGAWGIGCGAVSVEAQSWGRAKSAFR